MITSLSAIEIRMISNQANSATSDFHSPLIGGELSDFSSDGLDGKVSEFDGEKDDALQLLLAFGPAFARESRFWKSFVYSGLLGAAM